jgi:hypothetical protein
MNEPHIPPWVDSPPRPTASLPAPQLWVTMAAVEPDGINFSTDSNGPDLVRATLFRTIVHGIIAAGLDAWTAYLCDLPPAECLCPDDHLVLFLWPEAAPGSDTPLGWGAVIPTAADRPRFARRTYRALAHLLESPTALNCAANYLGGHPKPASRGHLKTGQ